VKSSLVIFLAGAAAFWAVACGVAFLLWEDDRELSLVYSATAAGLCVLPSAVTLIWALSRAADSPEMQRLIVLGGTGVRMFCVLGAGLALTSFVPYFQQRSFWTWALIFYLFTLALELALVVRRQSAAAAGRGQGTPAP
jgi:hypothetical protein